MVRPEQFFYFMWSILLHATCYGGRACSALPKISTQPVAPQRRHASLSNVNTSIQLWRLALGVSQRLWPALAVRVACRLFLTPLPLKWKQRGKFWDADWRIKGWSFENTTITVYSKALTPCRPIALLVHGWGGNAGQLIALAERLALKGLQSVIVEMPGHGRSTGTHSSLPQFGRGIDYVAARLHQHGFSLYALVGHALGASAAAYTVSHGLLIERLVLLEPPASPAYYTRWFAHVFGLSKKTCAAMQRRIEAREGKLLSQFEPSSLGSSIRTSTLVVYDKQDSIRWADGQAYARSIPDAQLITTQGLSHGTLLEDVQVLDQIATFIGN